MSQKLITLSDVAKICGQHNNELRKAFDRAGVKPLFVRAMGRGEAQYYAIDEVQAKLPQLLRPVTPAATAAAAVPALLGSTVTINEKLDTITRSLAVIDHDLAELAENTGNEHARMDVLIKGHQTMWKTLEEMKHLLLNIVEILTKPK